FPLGSGILSQLKVVGGTAYARVLPLDAWIKLAPSALSEGLVRPEALSIGAPLPRGDELIRVGTEDHLRVARVVGDAVTSGIELRPPAGLQFGEVALAESDGRDGYWLVVRVAAQGALRSDQYQVVHVKG